MKILLAHPVVAPSLRSVFDLKVEHSPVEKSRFISSYTPVQAFDTPTPDAGALDEIRSQVAHGLCHTLVLFEIHLLVFYTTP